MRPRSDYSYLIGKKVDRLTIIDVIRDDTISKYTVILCVCRCDCGNIVTVRKSNLFNGSTHSCGCYLIEANKERTITHGKTKTRLYKVWCGMRNRCYNSNLPYYKNYGGRGIKVCQEWLGDNGFENFNEWAFQNGYDENASRGDCTLDRIDVNGNYEPANCRFTDRKTQQNNKRTNHYIFYSGNRITLQQAAEISGLDKSIIYRRIHNGWTPEKTIETPLIVSKSRKVKN